MKNKTNLFRRIRNIIVGNTLPKNEDLWLDTSEGEKKATLKYKGNAINKGAEIEGVGDPSNEGKIVGYDAQGNLVPVNDASGGTITGTSGQIPVCDGQGNCAGSNNLYIDTDEDKISTSHGLSVAGKSSFADNISILGDVNMSGNALSVGSISSDGDGSFSGGVSILRYLTVEEDATLKGTVTVGDVSATSKLKMYNEDGDMFVLTIDTTGQLVITPA